MYMALMVTELSANETQTAFIDTFKQPPCSNHPGISNIRETREGEGRSSLIIVLGSDIDDETFKYCLQFIYTGT